MLKFIKNNANYWYFLAWLYALHFWVMTMRDRRLGEYISQNDTEERVRLHCVYGYILGDYLYLLAASVVLGGVFFVKEKWLLKTILIVISVVIFLLVTIFSHLSIGCT